MRISDELVDRARTHRRTAVAGARGAGTQAMRLSILALCAILSTSAFAAQVVGKNCAALWDTGTAAVSGPHLDCHDGDPTCDTDGAANHSCQVKVNACVGTATGCTAAPLTSIK